MSEPKIGQTPDLRALTKQVRKVVEMYRWYQGAKGVNAEEAGMASQALLRELAELTNSHNSALLEWEIAALSQLPPSVPSPVTHMNQGDSEELVARIDRLLPIDFGAKASDEGVYSVLIAAKRMLTQAPPPDAEGQTLPPAHLVEWAVEASTLSPCRSKRGAVVFRGGELISDGQNNKPTGFQCGMSAECKANCRNEAVHAEQRALLRAGRAAVGADLLHVKSVDGRLVPSGEPSCVQCSKLAVEAGIAGVWLFHESGWRRYGVRDFHRLSLAAQNPPPDAEGQTLRAAHELKTWPEFYAEVASGRKTFEIRKNDRDFKAGDALRLREFEPERNGMPAHFTGRECRRVITYMTDFAQQPDYVVLALAQTPPGVSWRCFYCGMVLTTEESAKAHFGARDGVPLCVVEAHPHVQQLRHQLRIEQLKREYPEAYGQSSPGVSAEQKKDEQ